MTRSAKRLVFWAPRLLGVAFALFVGVFALDAFEEGRGAWQTTLAFLIHLAPSAVILAALAASWRRGWIGAVVFTALGILHLVPAWGRLHWSAYAAISGPLFLLGALFLIDWRCGRESRARR